MKPSSTLHNLSSFESGLEAVKSFDAKSSSLSPTLLQALVESFEESSSLLPPALRSSFVLVGGATLVRWDRQRKTSDIDVACSREALIEFHARVLSTARFSF